MYYWWTQRYSASSNRYGSFSMKYKRSLSALDGDRCTLEVFHL